MPLTLAEIAPGVVAYFEPTSLHQRKDVLVTGDPVTRDGPFLCYARTDDESRWTPLTTEDKVVHGRSVRVKIDPSWVAHAFGPFAAGESFMQDGKNTYSGPHDAFITAAAQVDVQTAATRPRLTDAGVAAAQEYVQRRGGAS